MKWLDEGGAPRAWAIGPDLNQAVNHSVIQLLAYLEDHESLGISDFYAQVSVYYGEK